MLVIQQDTREKIGKHDNLENGFRKLGLSVERKCNNVGDYMIPNGRVSVDIKQDMVEITGNLLQDHTRFRNECVRAQEQGIKLYVLIEEETSMEELLSGRYKYPRKKNGQLITKANPKNIASIMKTMEKRYGVRFLFTNKFESPIKVALLLGISYADLYALCQNETYRNGILRLYNAKKERMSV